MNKIINKIIILCSVFLILLTGCSKKFDWDKTVNKLIDMRFDEVTRYETKVQVDVLNNLSNSLIDYYGGNFTIELNRAIYLVRNYRYDQGECKLYEFKTKSQAKQFVEFYIEIRSKDSSYKYAIENNIVVRSNHDIAMNVIGLDFK